MGKLLGSNVLLQTWIMIKGYVFYIQEARNFKSAGPKYLRVRTNESRFKIHDAQEPNI